MKIYEVLKQFTYLNDVVFRCVVNLHLQVIYQCNFICQTCDFWQHPNRLKPKLSLANVKMVIETIKSQGPQFISIEGGEPLLHDEIFEIIKLLAKDNFPIMRCNGWYITPKIAQNLFKAGLYEIAIPLDYASPEKHDRQKGQTGAYERAVRALRILNENRQKSNQRVHMVSIIMEDNRCEIEYLIRLAKKLGVTHLLSFYKEAKTNRVISTNIYKELLYQAAINQGLMDNVMQIGGSHIPSSLKYLKAGWPEFIELRAENNQDVDSRGSYAPGWDMKKRWHELQRHTPPRHSARSR